MAGFDIAEAILEQEERFVRYRLEDGPATEKELALRLRPWMASGRTKSATSRLLQRGEAERSRVNTGDGTTATVVRLRDRC